MNIIVGISDPGEIDPLVHGGATEFYGGLCPCGDFTFFNHRPSTKTFNFSNIQELRKAISICHAHGKNFMLAVNDRTYPQNGYKKIINSMLKIIEMGIGGFIIADFFLLFELQKKLYAKKIVTRLHLSSVANCFDKMTADFYKQFGISRIILPQQMYAREAVDIINKCGIETECFYHRANDCRFVDGSCYFCAFDFRTSTETVAGDWPCRYKFNILNWDKVKNINVLYSGWGVPPGINSYANLYDYVKMGITGVKIGVRHRFQFARKVKLLKELVKEISLIQKSPNKVSFLREVTNAV
jgi:collagenase-like PrtC family protease